MSQNTDNTTTKSIGRAIELIKLGVKLKDKGINIPLQLWGRHGIGKTTIVGEVAKQIGADYSIINLANLQPEDLLGQADFKTGGYKKPSFLGSLVGDDDEHTAPRKIYFLDEINRAPKYVLQSVFNFINEGRLNWWRIRPQDIVIAAANPSDGEYETTCFEDPAFLSRFAHVKVSPEKEEFMNFLGAQVKNTIVQQALKKSTTMYDDEEWNIGFHIVPDNRKLHKVGMMFDVLKPEEIEGVGVDMLETFVGFETASQLLEVYREAQKNVFEPAKILEKEPEDYGFSDNDIDIINNVNIKMCAFVKDTKLTKKQEKGLERYFMYLPKDIQVDFLKQLRIANEDTIKLIDMDYAFDLLSVSPNA